MFKLNYINFVFIFFITTYINTIECEDTKKSLHAIEEEETHSTQYEAEAINEIKKQLYDIYNYVLMNNYVPKAEEIPATVINEIIEKIIYSSDIFNNLVPLVMLQMELKKQNNINNEKILFNSKIHYYTALGFHGSIVFLYTILISKMFFNNDKSTFINILDKTISIICGLSSLGQLSTLIIKNKLAERKDFIAKTNAMLKEKKIEMNNLLINLLINALEEKIKLN
jgi:hypothetical protein